MRRMTHRDAADTEQHKALGSCPAGREKLVDTTSGSRDYMDYVADMILELRSLAEADDTPTLAGILDLAYREARIEAQRRSR